MDQNHTNKPDGNYHGLKEYFTQWIEGLEKYFNKSLEDLYAFLQERDRRYEERFKSSDGKTATALEASQRAIDKAEMATEKRFESVNEFRATLADQAAQFITKVEVNTRLGSVDEKIESVRNDIDGLRESRASGEGRHEQRGEIHKDTQWTIGIIIAVIFSAASLFFNLIKELLSGK